MVFCTIFGAGLQQTFDSWSKSGKDLSLLQGKSEALPQGGVSGVSLLFTSQYLALQFSGTQVGRTPFPPPRCGASPVTGWHPATTRHSLQVPVHLLINFPAGGRKGFRGEQHGEETVPVGRSPVIMQPVPEEQVRGGGPDASALALCPCVFCDILPSFCPDSPSGSSGW